MDSVAVAIVTHVIFPETHTIGHHQDDRDALDHL